jgi:hypothetical protein
MSSRRTSMAGAMDKAAGVAAPDGDEFVVTVSPVSERGEKGWILIKDSYKE